jgi:hypothetical protein
MKSSAFVFVFLATLSCQPTPGQNLQEAASKERARRDQLKSSSRIYTNEDFDRYKPNTEDRANPKDTSDELTPQKQRLAVEAVKLEDHGEGTWSRRFFEARSRLQEAEDQEKRLKKRLNELSGGCGPETYYDPYYFSYTGSDWKRIKGFLLLRDKLYQISKKRFDGVEIRRPGNAPS